jgi:hypothetical protein
MKVLIGLTPNYDRATFLCSDDHETGLFISYGRRQWPSHSVWMIPGTAEAVGEQEPR